MQFQPASLHAPEGYISLRAFADKFGLCLGTIKSMRQRGLFAGAIQFRLPGQNRPAWFVSDDIPRPVVQHKFGHPKDPVNITRLGPIVPADEAQLERIGKLVAGVKV